VNGGEGRSVTPEIVDAYCRISTRCSAEELREVWATVLFGSPLPLGKPNLRVIADELDALRDRVGKLSAERRRKI
jgi:hypothetical protein